MACEAYWAARRVEERQRAAQRAFDELAASMETGAAVVSRNAVTGEYEISGFDAAEYGFSDSCVLAFAAENAPLHVRLELEAKGIDLNEVQAQHAASHARGR